MAKDIPLGSLKSLKPLPTFEEYMVEADGTIIGKTKSGKDVYYDAKNSKHSDFTAEDHDDAAKLHTDAANAAYAKDKTDKSQAEHASQASIHDRKANKLRKGVNEGGPSDKIKGKDLTPDQKSQVLAAFVYRNTKENEANSKKHQPNLACTQTDDEWVNSHSFTFTKDGKLSNRTRHAEPDYMAEDDNSYGEAYTQNQKQLHDQVDRVVKPTLKTLPTEGAIEVLETYIKYLQTLL